MELKKNQTRRRYVEKHVDFFPGDRQTPARREARNHRSEDAEMLGPLPRGPQRTGRADQREARIGLMKPHMSSTLSQSSRLEKTREDILLPPVVGVVVVVGVVLGGEEVNNEAAAVRRTNTTF